MKTGLISYPKSMFLFLHNLARLSTHLERSSPEHDRLDGQSASLVALMNYRPFHAPVSQPRRILDIGCGTGAMTNLLASVYPEAQVIGIDIAPVPESRHGKRPNVEYIQGDIRELLGKDPRLELGSFDYVFQRFLLYGVTEWEVHLTSLTKSLRLGGWLEFQEPSAQLRSEDGDPVLVGERFHDEFFSQAAALGLNPAAGESLRQLMEATLGLTDVRENKYKFAPVARKDAPELEGLESQIFGLCAVLIRKFMGARGIAAAYAEQLVKEMRERWDKGFEEGDAYTMFAVVGQKGIA